ncbi:uroporphyrinogen-III synthase [Sphingomonas sp. ID0503]|uniref:uroporphyrinogen-III synthase n=1 Tax=Sphingomonas sp. ID0503 TaxID=3399691 RepID=UPI003AFB4063
MNPGVLVLRPEPGAATTAERAMKMGFAAVTAPLFKIVPVSWDAPEGIEALVLTSANAVRHGGEKLSAFHHIPVIAVAAATAAAAEEAGFTDVIIGGGTVESLASLVGGRSPAAILHPHGAEHRPLPIDGIISRTVYAAEPVAQLPEAARAALDAGCIALIHSAVAGATFAMLVDLASLDRATVRLAAISAAALSAAGGGWAGSAVAASPTDDAVLAAARRLCDQAWQDGAG